MAASALQLFHPLVRRWFEGRFAAPTDAQERAWPAIARGEHVLVSAPTGSGKTLTAFLWALDSLLAGRWSTGGVRALYLSPLKALGSDVRLNLLAPLAELRAIFEQEGASFPNLRVMTRSGDTPDEERRAMLRHPPEILITTPESLNLMLTGSQSRQLFAGTKTVILDEIHALAASKRGTYMMTAVERLVLGAGEFQRIALSATVRPPERIAAWMAGFECTSLGPDARFRPRPVTILESRDKRTIALALRSPDIEVVKGPDAADLRWQALARELKAIVAKNRSTLIFANSRRSVEKIARLLNADEPEPIAYSHHGSLSREIRLDVEERMKQGRLRAVVATGSLELGIDIGSVEEVVLIGTPSSVAQSLQRIGRANHRVGETSRATLFPLHGLDGAEAASMASLLGRTAIENSEPIANPLDVLAQVLLSMGCGVVWDLDQLFAVVRTIAAYHDLPRRHFDLVVAMLAGRYADSPVRELKPRALVDSVKNTFTTRAGTEFVLYQSGGTIPDRGYYHLRLADSKAVIGELDEEFVWERRLGDQFSLGTQTWRIHAITHNDVEVGPADPNAPMIPFWKAEDQNRSTETSFGFLDFLDFCEDRLKDRLDDSDFAGELERTRGMDTKTAENLVRFLRLQREVAQAPLPGRHRVLVECSKDASAPTQNQQVILHTFWGGRVNRPLAIAFAEAWERSQGSTLEAFATNDQILFALPDGFDPAGLFELLGRRPLDELLRAGLEKTPLFGARFRENASRALLLPRGDARKRYPLWLNRLRSKKLLAGVLRFQDFPIVLETWRDLLEDEFDLATLTAVLDDVRAKRTTLHVTRPSKPTPFSDGVVFRQTNYHMYLDDTPGGNPQSNLAEELFRDLFRGAVAQPTLPAALVASFGEKLLRTHPDYRPATPDEILLAVRELLLVPKAVALAWIAALPEGEDGLFTDLVSYVLPGATEELASDLGDLPRILLLRGTTGAELPRLGRLGGGDEGLLEYLSSKDHGPSDDDDGATLVADLLRTRVVLSSEEISATLGLSSSELRPLLDELLENETVVVGRLVEGRAEELFCDAENAERLLRLQRASRRAQAERSLPVRPITDLQPFLAEWHGLGRQVGGLDSLQRSLDRLFGFPLPAELWEEAVLPCRLSPYYPSWLDTLFQSYGLGWLGAGKQKLTLAFPSDYVLFSAPDEQSDEPPTDRVVGKLADAGRGLGFFDLAEASEIDTGTLAQTLWTLAWQGRVSSDSFETVRRGLLNGFSAERVADQPGRSGFRRWERSRPSVGTWQLVRKERGDGSIESAEIDKERARIVLGRYGVVFRELLEHELPPLRWSRLFRALRLLELSGEIVAGHFFDGVPGLQFATHEAVRRLAEPLPPDPVYFINACDPASLVGLGLPGLAPELPRRIPGNWIVGHGDALVVVLQKGGRELTILPPPGHASLGAALAIFRFLLGRQGAASTSFSVESINGIGALASPYLDDLRRAGFVNDYRGLSLWKR